MIDKLSAWVDAAEDIDLDVGQSFGSSENPALLPPSYQKVGKLSKGQYLSGGSLQRIPFLRLEKFSITLPGHCGSRNVLQIMVETRWRSTLQ